MTRGTWPALALLSILAACNTSTGPEQERLDTLLFAGIVWDQDSVPVPGATVGARVYGYDECGTGSEIDQGSTVADAAGSYAMNLDLQHGVRQCVAFGAWRMATGDTGSAPALPAWVMECTPGVAACTEASINIVITRPDP